MVFAMACAGPLAAAITPPGLELISTSNCTACHAASAASGAWLFPKPGPRLTEVASHARPAWLTQFLTSPQAAKPGTTMPDLLRGDTAKAEALTHFLLSTQPPANPPLLPDKAAAARGESLYHRIGCVACHAPQNGTAPPAGSVPLPPMEEKWTFDGLRRFLLDPLATRPSGRMPAMGLTDKESSDIAHYLLRGTRVPAAVEVAIYRNRIRSLEDFDTTEIERTAPAPALTLEGSLSERGSALRFTTWLTIPTTGPYTFYLNASTASRLAIDGEWIMGMDSWETRGIAENHLRRLDAGPHEIKVDFIRRGQETPSLAIEWEGPGIPRAPIPAALLTSTREPVPPAPAFTPDPAKAAAGRTLYASLNCAACHESTPAIPAPPSLESLAAHSNQGCLAETPAAPLPDYQFDGAQRQAIRESLSTFTKPNLPPPTPEEHLASTLSTFRCLQCHVRDGQGGVPADRSGFFTSNGDDLGEEGRLPPRLDGSGDKLRPEWIRQVLTEGAAVRPYLNTRMPQFGPANIGHLPDLLTTIDRNAVPVKPTSDSPEIQRAAGRLLTGTDGLSCIACHRFNRQPAHSLQVLDLTTTTQRLNEDWFRRFLRDPNPFNPGTRMPALWPGGHSLIPAVLEGDTDRQHAALWTYLADGTSAKFPEGLSRQNMELIVGGDPVVYRGKLWEAGFRAIATGYPGAVNAAFDAGEMRLALVWRGRFLNVSPHWSSQGMGSIHPLGTDEVILPHGAPFAILTHPEAPWPTTSSKATGMRFGGYQLDASKRPILLYGFNGLNIEDTLTPASPADPPSLHRTLKFTGPPPAGLHLRLATGSLSPAGPGQWRLNNSLTLKLPDATNALLRGKGAQQELLVPILSTSPLEIEYVW